MKILQEKTTRNTLNRQSCNKAVEKLPGGQSVTQAILMGGRACCGSAYVERA